MYVYVNELTASDVRENESHDLLFVSVSKQVSVRKNCYEIAFICKFIFMEIKLIFIRKGFEEDLL